MGFSFFRRIRNAGGEIRGTQVANYLGGRVDPQNGYEDDVCIYILGIMRYDSPEVRWSYYDVCDCGYARLQRVRSRTKGGLIAISKSQFDYLKKVVPKREVYFIRQHHCNFKRELRPKRPVLTVGCCGGDAAVQWPHDRIKAILGQLGLQWMFLQELRNHQRVVDFYKQLDIQLVYRPTHSRGMDMMIHGNPLKLSNASSFGIPTVAFPEPAFTAEWNNGECLYCDGMNNAFSLIQKLKDEPAFYEDIAEKAKLKAEEYHIDNVAKLYRELPGA